MTDSHSNKINVLIADDHPMMLVGIRNVLSTRTDIHIVGQALNGQEALEKVKLLNPDIAVIDINMPLVNGLEVAAIIGKDYKKTKVIILSMYDDREFVNRFLDSKASAYVLKNNSPEELLDAIDAVREGKAYFSPSISQSILKKHHSQNEKSPTALTDIEEKIAVLVARGFSHKQIADELLRSPRTVSSHIDTIKKKLKLPTTADIIRYVYEMGLIKLGK